MKHLILGGARSGKSRLAEQHASKFEAQALDVVYIATSDSRWHDAEMQNRIAQHRQQRPTHWRSVESPRQLADTLKREARANHCLLVDCLTLWLTNCLLADEQAGRLKDSPQWCAERDHLLELLPQLPGQILFVSNEVGQGVVPLGEINRKFVDEAGFLHQALGQVCERVTFVTAGFSNILKDSAH